MLQDFTRSNLNIFMSWLLALFAVQNVNEKSFAIRTPKLWNFLTKDCRLNNIFISLPPISILAAPICLVRGCVFNCCFILFYCIVFIYFIFILLIAWFYQSGYSHLRKWIILSLIYSCKVACKFSNYFKIKNEWTNNQSLASLLILPNIE